LLKQLLPYTLCSENLSFPYFSSIRFFNHFILYAHLYFAVKLPFLSLPFVSLQNINFLTYMVSNILIRHSIGTWFYFGEVSSDVRFRCQSRRWSTWESHTQRHSICSSSRDKAARIFPKLAATPVLTSSRDYWRRSVLQRSMQYSSSRTCTGHRSRTRCPAYASTQMAKAWKRGRRAGLPSRTSLCTNAMVWTDFISTSPYLQTLTVAY